MAKFKVIALNVTGANGRVFFAKTELNENQLGGLERANKLVKQGFLKNLAPKKEAKKVEEKKAVEPKKN